MRQKRKPTIGEEKTKTDKGEERETGCEDMTHGRCQFIEQASPTQAKYISAGNVSPSSTVAADETLILHVFPGVFFHHC